MHKRVREEIELLKAKYPTLQYGEQLNWVLIPELPLPSGRFNNPISKVLFSIPPGYPQTGPDNFFVDGSLRLHDGSNPPGFNQGNNSSCGPAPVSGDWGWFSWHPHIWRPSAIIENGDNLSSFFRGILICLRGEESG